MINTMSAKRSHWRTPAKLSNKSTWNDDSRFGVGVKCFECFDDLIWNTKQTHISNLGSNPYLNRGVLCWWSQTVFIKSTETALSFSYSFSHFLTIWCKDMSCYRSCIPKIILISPISFFHIWNLLNSYLEF